MSAEKRCTGLRTEDMEGCPPPAWQTSIPPDYELEEEIRKQLGSIGIEIWEYVSRYIVNEGDIIFNRWDNWLIAIIGKSLDNANLTEIA